MTDAGRRRRARRTGSRRVRSGGRRRGAARSDGRRAAVRGGCRGRLMPSSAHVVGGDHAVVALVGVVHEDRGAVGREGEAEQALVERVDAGVGGEVEHGRRAARAGRQRLHPPAALGDVDRIVARSPRDVGRHVEVPDALPARTAAGRRSPASGTVVVGPPAGVVVGGEVVSGGLVVLGAVLDDDRPCSPRWRGGDPGAGVDARPLVGPAARGQEREHAHDPHPRQPRHPPSVRTSDGRCSPPHGA